MRTNPFLLASLALLLSAFAASAIEPTSGWRNDGTGHYPAAVNPPTAWSRTSAAVDALRFLTEKPADPPQPALPMPDGVIRQWLILGPVPAVKGQDALPNEADLAPAGDRTWKKVTLDSAWLDFNALLGKPATPDVAAFAFVNLFSPAPAQFQLNFTAIDTATVYLNGKKIPAGRTNLDLAMGWNRLLLRVSPGEKDWYAVPVLLARGRTEYAQSNIAWRIPLPGVHPAFYGGGSGAGAPVIVGDNLYLQSEPHDLICIDKATGKIKWLRRASFYEAATDDEKQNPAYADAKPIAEKLDALNAALIAAPAAKLAQTEEKAKLEKALQKQMKLIDAKRYASQVVPDVGFSGFTPSTDGQFIYAWFGDGVTACFGLDGTPRWIRADQHTAVEHGFSSSPLLIDGKFVVFMRDLIAFDAGTGKLVWQTPIVSPEGDNPGNFIHGSLVAADIAGTRVIVLGNGIIVRAADGKILTPDTKSDNQAVPSPVAQGDQLFHITKGNSQLTIRPIPAALTEPLKLAPRDIPIDLSAFPKHYLPWHLSSPLIHDGLAYLLNNAGVLSVIDIQTGELCYQKLVDLDPFQGHNEGSARGVGVSPIRAGKYIYLFGNNGAALVLEPGRTYRQVAKNKLESVTMPGHWSQRQERFVANPIADGNTLYIRGEEYLYAISAR